LKGLQPVGAETIPGGYVLQMVANEDEVVGLARICHGLIREAEKLYGLRWTAPGP
jgi:hypothetical protein